jgi:hypothetical protein
MLLTISLTRPPATDLGYLLHKSPGRVHTRSLSFGPAHVFYPVATDERCTAVLLLDIDPVGLVRGRRPGPSLEPYVNDRPYVASSFLSSAIAEHFGTAMSGRSKERQALADEALPLEATIPVLPARGGEAVVRRLFEPLGYAVEASGQALHPSFPDWGEAPYLPLDREVFPHGTSIAKVSGGPDGFVAIGGRADAPDGPSSMASRSRNSRSPAWCRSSPRGRSADSTAGAAAAPRILSIDPCSSRVGVAPALLSAA